MLLNDRQITALGAIHPFVGYKVSHCMGGNPVVSYGLQSCGYDIRLANEYLLPRDEVKRYDPHGMREDMYQRVRSQTYDIEPGHMVLARSLETITMPSDVMGLVLGKSTYARLGLLVNATPLEPDWKGTITLELSNTAHVPVRVWAGEGIAQILFFRSEPPARTYRGAYQNQTGITPPRLVANPDPPCIEE